MDTYPQELIVSSGGPYNEDDAETGLLITIAGDDLGGIVLADNARRLGNRIAFQLPVDQELVVNLLLSAFVSEESIAVGIWKDAQLLGQYAAQVVQHQAVAAAQAWSIALLLLTDDTTQLNELGKVKATEYYVRLTQQLDQEFDGDVERFGPHIAQSALQLIGLEQKMSKVRTAIWDNLRAVCEAQDGVEKTMREQCEQKTPAEAVAYLDEIAEQVRANPPKGVDVLPVICRVRADYVSKS